MLNPRLREVFEQNVNQIQRLTRASEVVITEKLEAPKASAKAVLSSDGEVAVPLAGLIDFTEETKRLQRKKEKLESEATKLQAQLANPDFAQRAPAEKVQQTQSRISEVQLHIKALDQLIENLK
jgi:valyl-tRNA synthetase